MNGGKRVLSMTTNDNSTSGEPDKVGLVALFKQDLTPLCFMGLCLELLRMQRHVDDRLEQMGVTPSPGDLTKYNLIFLVFRAYGLEATFLKAVPVLLQDWERHKKSGARDIDFLNTLNAKLTAWRAAVSQATHNN